MAIRNFWIDAVVDGRKTRVTGGPKWKHGGLSLTVCQRNEGEIECPLHVECITETDGTLTMRVYWGAVLLKEYNTLR